MRLLMITSEWPTLEHPASGIFIARQVEQLRQAGIDVDLFYFRGAKNPLIYLSTWKNVQGKLKHSSYDLIHAQFGQSGLLVLLPKRLPLVVTFRGSDVKGIIGRNGKFTVSGHVLKNASRLVAALAEERIVVSTDLIKHLPNLKYHVVPSGIDLDHFRPIEQIDARRMLALPLEPYFVLFGGNPDVARKRYGLAKNAVDLIGDRFSDVRLIVAKGIPHREMWLFMNACDVLLLTSSHEGSPNVVKEALACNLPVVSSKVGDVQERIGSVDGCVICEDDHPKTIANGLMQVLSRKLRIEGREKVRDLDEKILTKKVIAIYQQALSNG